MPVGRGLPPSRSRSVRASRSLYGHIPRRSCPNQTRSLTWSPIILAQQQQQQQHLPSREIHTHESILRPHPSFWSSLPSAAASEQKKTLMGEEFIEPLSTCVYAPPHLSRVSIIKPRVLCSVCTHPALLPQIPPLRMCAVLFDRSIVRQSAEVWQED